MPTLDELYEQHKKKQGQSASQSGGAAYSESKTAVASNSGKTLDEMYSGFQKNPTAIRPAAQAPVAQEPAPEKKGVWSSITGGVKKAASKAVDLGERGLRAGLDLWNSNQQKNEEINFEMRERLYGRKTLVQDPVTGKKTLTTEALTAFKSAQTPEEKNAIIQKQQQNIPLIKAMNSPTGRSVLGYIGEKTSNIPLKAIATLRSIGDETYDEAYAALEADRKNPENGAFKSFLYELQDSGIQSALGVVLSLGTTYVSKSPNAGRTVGSTYFAGISAAGQQEERGEVNSLGNIGIDVIGDQILSTSLETVFKGGGSVLKAALKSAGIEGTTEVSQSFLKYGNDYGNARTEEEKAKVLADARKYVVEGGILMEFAVGATAGGAIGATAEYVAPTMTLDISEGQDMPEAGASPKEDEKKPPIINTPESEGYYSNARDILAEYESALNAGETVANDEEFENVGALRDQLDDYQTLNKDKTFFLPDRASVEVVEYDDGNFAYRFNATAGEFSVTSPFLNTDLKKSKQEATEAGLKEIIDWIRIQREEASTPEERMALSQLQDDMIEEAQRGEQDYSDIIAEATGGRSEAAAEEEAPAKAFKFGDGGSMDTKKALKSAGFGVEAMGFGESADVDTIDGVPAVAYSWIDEGLAGFSVAKQFRGQGVATQWLTEVMEGMGGTLYVVDPNDAMLAVLKKVGDVSEIDDIGRVKVTARKAPEKKAKTQKEKVQDTLKEKGAASVKEIAEETGILEPNVRRILGVGAKEGTFERVEKGVYTLSIGGKDIAFIETGNAVESLPRLAAEGFKADMIFLDIPYDTAAVKGGNRGVKYDLLSVEDFKKVVSAVSTIARTDDTPVLHMFSQAVSGMKDMQKYNDVLTDAGFKPIAKGEWQKLFKDGRPVTNVRGQVAKPEGILLLSKSGEVSGLPENVSLDFSFVRPKGYSTEKPAEMLKELIELTTEEDAMVLDPFAGSGVTAAEAVRSGRRAYAIEKNEDVAENITKPRVKEAVDERSATEEAPAPKATKRKAARGFITLEPEDLSEVEIETARGGAEGVGSLDARVLTIDGEVYTVPEQRVTKTQLKAILGSADSMDFTVIEKEGELFMTYETENGRGALRPRALGIVEAKLKEGQVMRVTKEALKKKGTSLRAYNAGGNAVGFIPRDELRDEVFAPIQEKLDRTKRVSGRAAPPTTTAPEPSTPNAIGFIPRNLADVDSKAGRKEVEKIIKRKDIAADLSEKLGVPIRRGKFRGKALGIYKPDQKLIRYKKGGLPTIFHEAGHFIDYTVFPFGNEIYKNFEEITALTEEYGAPLNTPKRQKEEAFAEFMRFYMTDIEKARTKAPKFFAFFEAQMRQLPEVSEVIERAKLDFERWNEMPATQKVLSQVSLEPEDESFRERFKGSISNLYSQAIDDLNPIFEYTRLAEKKLGDLPAEESPYVLARNFRGWIGKANAFLETGTFGKKFWTENEKGKIVPEFKGKSFQVIVKPIENAGALEDFTVYLISKRTVELTGREKPIETGVSQADAKAAIAELDKKHPEFAQAALDLYKYQDDLLVFGYENGLYDSKALEVIRGMNQAYVPFYRVMEEIEGAGGVGKGFGNVRSSIKRIKGSDREIINPLESIVKNTYAVINAAERNNVATAIVSLSAKDSALGQMVEKVATPMQKAATVGEEEIIKAVKDKLMKEQGIFGEGLSPETENELAGILVNVFRPAMIAKDNTITVLKDGKRTFYEVEEDLYRAMQGLDVEHVGAILKLLSYPARFLRAGATLTPEFVLRNPMRDQWSAFVYSKYNFIPFVDLTRGMFSLFRKDSDYWLWRMGGGEHSMLASLDREYLQHTFDDVVASRDIRTARGIKTVLLDLKNPLKIMQILSEYTEKGTRLGEAKRALRTGANPIDAAYAAREVTLDFARIGEKTKAVNAIVAFFNAQVQGQDKMYRSFRDKPVRTLTKTMLGITLPSIILYFLNRDEEGWDEIPQWQKDLFWLLKVGDTWYRIPKPFELGILFGSVPERILEYMDKRDPQLFTDLRQSVTGGMTPSFMPTFMLPIVENITNYNFFLERAIVPQSKTSLPPEAQYGNFTSETAKELGKLIGYSPAKIDNLIRGYFAGLGQYAVQVMDAALKGTGITHAVVAPAEELADQPILKAFIVKAPEGSGSVSVERFYQEWERANEADKYIKSLMKDGDDEAAYAFLAEHPEAELAKYYNDVQAEISAMNKARNEVFESETLSAEEKRTILNDIDKEMTIVAHNAIQMSLDYGETD